MKDGPFFPDPSPLLIQSGRPDIPNSQPRPWLGGHAGATTDAYEYVDEPDRGGLLEYLRILRGHKIALLLMAFLGALIGTLITLSQVPVYQAHVSLEIEELSPDPSNMKQVGPVSESSSSTAITDIPTQIKILQSESLIERAATKLGTMRAQDPRPEERRVPAWRKALNWPESHSSKEDVLTTARNNLNVRADGPTRIVDILYDSADPKDAADFANALANEFIEQNIEARWNMSQSTGDWLNRQLEEMRIKLERSEGALQAYASQFGLMFTSDKNNVSDEKLRQLQMALSNAQMDRIAKQSRFEMAQSNAPETLPDILNDVVLREYQSKMADLLRRRAELAIFYTAEYGKVKQVDAEIESLESTLEKERAAVTQRIRNDYEETSRREKLLAAQYATQERLINHQAEKAIPYNILKREVDSNRQLYDAMLQRMKAVSVASALRTSNVRIVDRAKLPRFPYKPRLSVNASLGSLTSFFLAVVLMIVRDRGNRTLQDRGDVNRYLNLPELAVIPVAGRSRKFRDGSGQRRSLMRAKDRAELIVPHSGLSPVAEGFRAALASILFSGRNGSRPQVLVLTSWSPGEGKTTTVSNLGVALAEIGQRVLLVDADMRKPRLHEVFSVPNKSGLTDLLLGTERLGFQAVQDAIEGTRIHGLSLLTSGPVATSPTNLLYSQRAKELLQLLRNSYDTILIDTPPMQHITDVRVLGTMADAVILVLRASSTSRDAGRAAKQRFLEDGTRVLGAILNFWDPKQGNSDRYGYHDSRPADSLNEA